MVVVDSSALVPLAWVGRLNLVTDVLEDIRTVDGVRAEVLVEGKRGVATLETLLDGVSMHPRPSNAERVAELEGLSVTDAAVILLADAENDVLLANDKALIDVAESHGIEGWWVTTLLLKCAKEGVLSGDEATDVLYELVDEGTNLNPKVYARLQRELHENGE